MAAAPSEVSDSGPAAHATLRSVLEFEEEDAQVRFDEVARRLVLIKHRCFVALPLNRSLQPITVQSNGKVEAVRFSLNHRFAAVQRSEVEIEFMDLLQGSSFSHTCKGGGSRGRWRILAFHWTGTPVADFVVVTTAGIEFYLVLPERSSLKLVKSSAHAVAWSVYSHVTRLVLLATGPQDNIMHGIQIQPSSLVRIPKFEVALAPPVEPPVSARVSGQAKLRRSLLPGNLGVARLYDMIFCVHSETERQQVHLYQLFKDYVVRKYALAVYSSSASVSVSDNLLIVHALDSKVALIFDLKINTQFPITAPLPIATIAADGFSPLYSPHWSLAPPDYIIDPQAGRVGQLQLDLHTIARSSIDKACLLQFLLSRTHCASVILEVFAKSIDEEEGLPVLARMFDLLHAATARSLLTRRAFGASVAAAALASPRPTKPRVTPVPAADTSVDVSAGETTSASSSVSASVRDSVSGVSTADADDAGRSSPPPATPPATPPTTPAAAPAAAPAADVSASASDTSLDSARPPQLLEAPSPAAAAQSNGEREGPPDSALFVARVFETAVAQLPKPADAQNARRRYVLAVLTEYLHSQQQHALTLDVSAGMLLLTLLEEQGSFYQLHQFVQYHLVPDSLELAYRLLALESKYPPAVELAMDMFKRLGPLGNDALMSCLLERGQLLAACRFIRSQRLLTYPPRPLLAAAASKEPPTFAAVFTFFRQRNEVWRGSPAFLPEEECEEYVAMWEAMFGEPPTNPPLTSRSSVESVSDGLGGVGIDEGAGAILAEAPSTPPHRLSPPAESMAESPAAASPSHEQEAAAQPDGTSDAPSPSPAPPET